MFCDLMICDKMLLPLFFTGDALFLCCANVCCTCTKGKLRNCIFLYFSLKPINYLSKNKGYRLRSKANQNVRTSLRRSYYCYFMLHSNSASVLKTKMHVYRRIAPFNVNNEKSASQTQIKRHFCFMKFI